MNKIKSSNIGVDGICRTIKKMYIGIDGTAQPVYPPTGNLQLVNKGFIGPIPLTGQNTIQGKNAIHGVNLNDKYAVFHVRGNNLWVYYTKDCFAKTFSASYVAPLESGITTTQHHIICYGGREYRYDSSLGYSTFFNKYDVFSIDENFVTTSLSPIPSDMNTAPNNSVMFNKKAIFTHGSQPWTIYDDQLVQTTFDTEVHPINVAIFDKYLVASESPTTTGYYKPQIHIYDQNLVKLETLYNTYKYGSDIQTTSPCIMGANDDYVFCILDQRHVKTYPNWHDVESYYERDVDAFDKEFVKHSCPTVNYEVTSFVKLGNYALFTGLFYVNFANDTYTYKYSRQYIAYTPDLLKKTFNLSGSPKSHIACVALDNYAFITGGSNGTSSDTVFYNETEIIALE